MLISVVAKDFAPKLANVVYANYYTFILVMNIILGC